MTVTSRRRERRLTLTVAFLAAGGGNLLFHLVAVAALGPSEFAGFGVLVALTALASLPLGSVEVAFASAIARGLERGTVGADVVVATYQRLVFIPGLVVSACVAGGSLVILDLSVFDAVLLAVFLSAAVQTTLGRAMLMGTRAWSAASMVVLCPAAVRFAMLLMLTSADSRLSGTMLMAVTVAGEAAAASLGTALVRAHFSPDGSGIEVAAGDLAVAFGSLAPVALLAGADVIMARLALPVVEAGRIAAAANVARAGLYLPQAVAFSSLTDLSVGSARRAATLLWRAASLLVVLTAVGVGVLTAIRGQVASLLLGDPTLGDLLPPLTVAAAGAGLTHLVVVAMLARRVRWSLFPLAAVPFVAGAALLGSTAQVLTAAAGLTSATALVGMSLFAWRRRVADRGQRWLVPDGALAGRSVSVVVPSYCPGPRFEAHVRELARALDASAAATWEVIVVDDGCPDGSASRTTALRLPGVRALTYDCNRGKGYAVRYGIGHSTGDVVGFVDADGEIPAAVAVDLAAAVAAGFGEAVVGDKTHPDSTTAKSLLRRVCTFGWGTVVQVLLRLPVADTQVGVKMWDGALARRCARTTTEDGFAFDLEMLLRTAAEGGRIVSAPVSILEQDGASSITVRHLDDMVRAAVRLRVRPAAEPTTAVIGVGVPLEAA